MYKTGVIFYSLSEWSMKFSLYKKQGSRATFSMPKVLYPCRLLSPLIVPIQVIYNVAKLNDIDIDIVDRLP